uniref:Uncharacterized protein F5E19_10 n=1 Tax=Arabidopsis thaliana TaxID=3702 RepID=Q9LFF0_ARATH|nr:putative protein [Arabidopsis thaliana]
MASCIATAPLSLSGVSQSHYVKANGLSTTTKLSSICKTSDLTIHKKSNRTRKFSVSAGYRMEVEAEAVVISLLVFF